MYIFQDQWEQILVLYVNDILLASNDLNLLHDTKQMLSKTFDMKDLGETSFILGIEINRDRIQGLLGLSLKLYIDHVLNHFNMQDCRAREVSIAKRELPNKKNYPKNIMEQ